MVKTEKPGCNGDNLSDHPHPKIDETIKAVRARLQAEARDALQRLHDLDADDDDKGSRVHIGLMKMQALARQEGGSHYKGAGIEPAQYIIANDMPWADGNVIKYASRHFDKGKDVDVKKIIHYAMMMLEAYYGITTQVVFSDETSLDDLPPDEDE